MDKPSNHQAFGAAVRFLKLDPPPVGPVDLLGLEGPPEGWTPSAIAGALLARLEMIDEHPQSRTPEADELRVALHVAAAQLRDPLVRASLVEAPDTGVTSAAPEPTAAPAQPDPLAAPGALEAGRQSPPASLGIPAHAGADDDFYTAARHVLASCGGWNAESKRRLGYLARSASVDAAVLQQTLVTITRTHEQIPAQRGGAPAGVPASAGDETPRAPTHTAYVVDLSRSNYANRPLDRGPSDPRARTWMTISTVLMLLSSVAIASVLLAVIVQRALVDPPEVQTKTVLIGGAGQGTESGLPAGAAPDAGEEPPDVAPAPTGVGSETTLDDIVRLVRSLDSEAFRAAEAESVQTFEAAFDRFSRAWITADADALGVAPLAFRDAVLAASEHDQTLGARLVGIIDSRLHPLDAPERVLDPELLRSSAFAFGVAGLLIETPIEPRTERGLRSRLNSITSEVNTGLDARKFVDLVALSLQVQARDLVPRASEQGGHGLVEAWEAWTAVCEALPVANARELKLDAIERIATEGEDPVFHEPTEKILSLLVRTVDWLGDADRVASRRLLQWFDDTAGVDAKALSVITAELVDGALLPGISQELHLAPAASPNDRRVMRDQYALHMGLPQVGDGRLFASEWAGYAEELLAAGLPQDHQQALNSAIRAAWLNESASLWLASDENGARSALEKAKGSLQALAASSSGAVSFGTRPTPRADGEWAAEYLQARRSTEDRIRLLYDLSNSGGPAGQADADVLAEAASYSTPIEVRRVAQRAVTDFASRPEVILGLLEVLPRASKQDGVSDMIAEVTGQAMPPVTNQQWRLQARRALVARAMEMLMERDQRILDVVSAALADSYAVRLDLLPLAPSAQNRAPLSPDAFTQPVAADQTLANDPYPVLSRICERIEQQAARYPERTPLFASLDEIMSRREWRSRLASNHIGAFASELTSYLELTAYVLGCERPDLAAEVGAVIDGASSLRRDATSVYEQIAANELGVLRLNLLRLTGGQQ